MNKFNKAIIKSLNQSGNSYEKDSGIQHEKFGVNTCAQKLSNAATPEEIFKVLFVDCKNNEPQISKASDGPLAIFTDVVVIGIARFTQYLSKYVNYSLLEKVMRKYDNTNLVKYGPWIKFYLMFCSDEMKEFLNACQKAVRTLALMGADISNAAKIIAGAIFNVFKAIGTGGILPPGLTIEMLNSLFEKELTALSSGPILNQGLETPIGKLCDKMNNIAEQLYESLDSGAVKDKADQLIRDIWGKLSTMAGVTFEVIGNVTYWSLKVLNSALAWMSSHPGTTLTFAALIAIAATVEIGSLGTATPAVAVALLAIAAALGIDTSGWNQSKVEEALKNNGV
jgi:hypothetical protein